MEIMDKQIRDIINKGEDEAPVLDKVIKDIFMSCDTENEGFVPVSKLVEFIMPFLQGNVHALDELQKSLDPNGIDPIIDIDTFYKDMNEWTLKISSADHIDEEDILNVTPRDFERLMDKDFSCLQSTPRSSFGHHLLKGYVESGISNLSIVSGANESQSLYYPDRTILEEQIQELQHQKRQVNEELMRVKMELTSATEQNETLQAELERAYKKVANEQKVITQLQSERKKDDDCEEELCCARKQVVKLERSIASLEKQNVQLQHELDAVLMEKHALEHQIQRMDRKSEETKSNMVILQTEIDIRKSEVVSEHKTNEALAQHNQELCDIIEKCIITIDRLKLEKAMLNKYYRDRMIKGESLLGVDIARSARSNSFSEYAGISRKPINRRRVSDVSAKYYSPACRARPFNSPKLLRMLQEPVTPTLDGNANPSVKRSTSREDVSAVGNRNDVSVATMLLNRTNPSTYQNKQEQRSLLDLTPPLEISRLSVLSPKHLCPAPPSDRVAMEMLELILEKTIGTVNGDGRHFSVASSMNSVDSPPVMYIIERTPENEHCERSSPTPYSPKMNDGPDEFFFYNYDMMAGGERQNENLLEEMAKATVCGIGEESEYEDSISEVGRDKCDETPERNRKAYVSQVHLKLDEFIDLEQKCEVLEQKIEELENENSTKDMKIVDLNKEIEKMREKISRDSKDKIEELLKRIDQLEYEKNILQIEKKHLVDEIRVLSEEKSILQLSKEELLLKVVEHERQTKRGGDKSMSLENLLDREILQKDSSKSRLENRECAKEDFDCLKLDYERVKSSMETYQKLNENLLLKNSLLQKTVSEKEKILEENLEEIVQIREVSENLKDQVYELSKELDDAKRSCINLEHELKRTEMDLSRAQGKSHRNEKIIEEKDKVLKNSEMERARLNELLEKTQEQLRESFEFSDKKQHYEETKRRLEQEMKKQEYLCKKFLNLENELIEEKNSSLRFKEKCDSLQADISTFRETMTKLEEEMTRTHEENEKIVADNEDLKRTYENKAREVLALMDAKNFLAKRNEELLQENAEIFLKLDFLTKELEDANERLMGMEKLRAENRRIKAESEEIFQKLRMFDSDDTESDQVDDCRREFGGLQKNRDRRTSRKTSNFDRLNVRNTKLEEKNQALLEQVSDLQERLGKEVESKNSVLNHMNTIKDILGERRIRLGRATDSTFSVWGDLLRKFTNSDVFGEDLEPDSPVLVITGPLDEEMQQLKHQIHVTTVLLSHLTYFMNRQMLKKNEFTQTEAENSVALHRVGEVSTTRMEETFATLVLTYTVDKDLLHQRFHSQKVALGETERSLGEAVSSLTLFLEENARGLDVSHYMDRIFQLCTQVSISAVQYGSLRQQTELTAAAEMMVNYVGNLKQEIESLTQQLPAIGPTTTLIDQIEFQPEEKPAPANVNALPGHPQRFMSRAKTACIMFTLSMFVLVASLVLNTDVVFKYHRCPPPT